MRAKRLFDLLFTIPGLILVFPLFLFIALWIKLDSPGPIFFRQERVGFGGRPFMILKFRTMVMNAESIGPKVTSDGDPRITRSGRWLRKYKLDELPQLINVLKGEMSLVGPRPEVPEYVAHYPADVREQVLSVPPGITDFAAIEFRDENTMLEHAADPQRTYLERILPIKLKLYLKYVRERSLWTDFVLILRTMAKVVRHS
ncbi:MAG: sugar transferase [Zetaproteobacteria bacterium]|nr:MAG: sugar transferase [Zetaproteobacteria bacterium]